MKWKSSGTDIPQGSERHTQIAGPLYGEGVAYGLSFSSTDPYTAQYPGFLIIAWIQDFDQHEHLSTEVERIAAAAVAMMWGDWDFQIQYQIKYWGLSTSKNDQRYSQ